MQAYPVSARGDFSFQARIRNFRICKYFFSREHLGRKKTGGKVATNIAFHAGTKNPRQKIHSGAKIAIKKIDFSPMPEKPFRKLQKSGF